MRRQLISIAIALAAAALAACSPHFDWREVRSAEGGFVVLLPGKPGTVAREIDFGGEKVTMTMTSTGIGPTLFAVGVAVLPARALAAQPPEELVAWFGNALVRNVGGTTAPLAPIEARSGAGPGRPVRTARSVNATGRAAADGRAMELAARLYLVDDRLYQVVAIGAAGEIAPRELETFFDSFRLSN